MTNVSKKPIKKEILQKTSNRLNEIFSKLGNNTNTKLFLEDFLTNSERIMLSKRLTLIFMLSENVPFSVITRTLNVSPATVGKTARILDRGGYKNALAIFKKTKSSKLFWKQIETLFRTEMPKYGRGRWNFLPKNPGR